MICTKCKEEFRLGDPIYTAPVIFTLDIEESAEVTAEALCEGCFHDTLHD